MYLSLNYFQVMEFELNILENAKPICLKGILPIFQANGPFELPSIMYDKPLFEKIVKENVFHGRTLWEEKDDAGIEVLVRENVVTAAHVNPKADMRSDIMEFILSIYSGLSKGEEEDIEVILEEYPEYNVGYKTIIKRQDAFEVFKSI